MVECWFIGGPWDNRLVPIPRSLAEPERVLIVSDPREIGPMPAIGASPLDFDNGRIPTFEYYPMVPLETGVPVYSCLPDAAYGRGGYVFGLKSVQPRKAS